MTNNRHNIHFIAALGPIISDHIVFNSLVAVSSTTKTLQQIKTFVETINTLIDTKLPIENTSEIIFASIRK